MTRTQKRIEEIRKLAPLTPIDLILADADALILLARLRKDNPRGFFELTRALTRIVRRVVNGNSRAADPVRGETTADGTILALVYQLVDLQPAREVR